MNSSLNRPNHGFDSKISLFRLFAFTIFPIGFSAYITAVVGFGNTINHDLIKLLFIIVGLIQVLSAIAGGSHRQFFFVIGGCYAFVGALTLLLSDAANFFIVRVSFVMVYMLPFIIIAQLYIMMGVNRRKLQKGPLNIVIGIILMIISISTIPAMFNNETLLLVAASHLFISALGYLEFQRVS